MTSPVDWLALDDDTWSIVGKHLGLHVLTLRCTCAAFQRRVFKLDELPVAIQKARRIVLLWLEDGRRKGPQRNAERDLGTDPIMRELMGMPMLDLIDTINTLDNPTSLLVTKLQCNELTHSFRVKRSLKTCAWPTYWFSPRTLLAFSSADNRDTAEHNTKPLLDASQEDDLINAMRFFDAHDVLSPNRRLNYSITGDPSLPTRYTTPWHLAAKYGQLKVLRYLYHVIDRDSKRTHPLWTSHRSLYRQLCVQAQTSNGDNAMAHAQRALDERCAACANAPDASAQIKALQERYDPVFKFLDELSVKRREWQDPGTDDDEDGVDGDGDPWAPE